MPVLGALLAVAYFSTLNYGSPILRRFGVIPAGDQAVFTYVGREWFNGQVPYAEAFDNKGPVLYLLNGLGYLIDKQWGIWLLEMVALSAAVLLCYRLLLRLSDRSIAIGGTVVTFLMYSLVYEGGNLAQDWALPATFALLLIAEGALRARVVSRETLFASGMLGGAVALLLPSLAAAWACFLVSVIVSMRERSAADRVGAVAAVVAGGIVVAMPALLYFAGVGAFPEFLDGYLGFNMRHLATAAWSERLTFLLWAFSVIVLLAPSLAYYIYRAVSSSSERDWNAFLAASTALTLWMASLAGGRYTHYLILVVPMLAPATVGLAQAVKSRMREASGTVALVALGVPLLVQAGVDYGRPLTGSTLHWASVSSQTASVIADITDPGEEILAFGYSPEIYVESDTVAPSRFFYQVPILNMSPEFRDEFRREFRDDPPRVLVFTEIGNDLDVWPTYLEELVRPVADDYRQLSGPAAGLPDGVEVWVRE